MVFCGAFAVGAVAIPSASAPTERTIEYDRDVRPILSDNCFKCHGPAAATVAADLRLDLASSALTERDGTFVLKPGQPEQSVLLNRVSEKSPEMRMPPPASGKGALTSEERETLRLWIKQGAKYAPHWSFLPAKKPKVPAVKNKNWLKNELDAFVLARLESEGLKPEPEADKETLLRRVSLALVGLPPTISEVNAFQADKKPGAYERAVDRLLASPRYGEHQARYWLDAVRYGDTHGLHLDNERSIYPYRDWVVRSFNTDLPFDKFTVWQLAGDMLPNPTAEQKIATGYIRMNPTTNEGGAIEAEFQAKNTFDRVETTSTVFLGLTTGCARCHDHKFDPISHKNYFEMFAFFNSTADKPLDGNELTPAPVMRAATPEQDAHLSGLRSKLNSLEKAVAFAVADKWLASARVEPPTATKWEVSQAYPSSSFDTAFAQEFGPEPGGLPDTATWKPLALELGKPLANIVGKETAAGFVRAQVHSATERDLEIRVQSDDGVKVWVNGALIHDNKILRGVPDSTDTVKIHLVKGKNDLLFKIVNSFGPDGIGVNFGDPIAQRIDQAFKNKAKPGYEAELRKLYLEAGPETAASSTYRKTKGEIVEIEASIPFTLVAEELMKPRPAYILKRGEYDQPTTEVKRALPAFLGKLPAGAPNNRLGLAQWLVDPKNPLVSRVFVNRIWQQHFGTGIVKTAEDFGNQGEWPSHPDLMDYLAIRFVKDGWSIKKLHRLLVTSAAFRQAASGSAAKRAKDPENRLISRGPRFRLDAEVLRDQALYVGGLLVEKRGGKGVKPYQPPGLWEAIAFTDSTTARYVQDHGDALYRRSLYLFWKRTSPPPAMLTFDAPMRESCVVRRSRTNTPLQALVTMNDPAFFEAARGFAERLTSAKNNDADRIQLAFKAALSRYPKPDELAVFQKSVLRYRAALTKDEATELLKVGEAKVKSAVGEKELAIWTILASTLMNTDEFLTMH